MTRRVAAWSCLTLALACASGDVAQAYLRQFQDIDGRRVFLKWSQPTIRYSINPTTVPNVTTAQLQTVMGRAFDRWQNVPTAAISFQFAGVAGAVPLDFDGVNAIGFLDAPEFEGVLGLSLTTFDTVTGETVESDIFFNSVEQWSAAEAGETDRFDLESVAVHEAGHFLGLDHSAIGHFEEQDGDIRLAGAEAIMFPFAFDPGNIAMRALRPDDVAGASAIYPDGGFADETGILEGRIVKGDVGVYGAHVLALNPVTGRMVGGFSVSPTGGFRIEGLEPGRYVVRVEPIDDIGIDSFFQESEVPIEVDFGPRFFDRFVGVPAGGASASFDVLVLAR